LGSFGHLIKGKSRKQAKLSAFAVGTKGKQTETKTITTHDLISAEHNRTEVKLTSKTCPPTSMH